jgi:hypothetical protein
MRQSFRFFRLKRGFAAYAATVLAIAGSVAAPFSAFAAPPAGNLVAYWAMNETNGTTVSNSAGSSYVGTIIGTPTWAPGKVGNGLTFDGTNSVLLGDIGPIDNANKVTLAAWIKRSESNARVLIGKQVKKNDFAIEAWDDGLVYFGASNGTWVDGAFALNDTAWHHVMLVFDGIYRRDEAHAHVFRNGSDAYDK